MNIAGDAKPAPYYFISYSRQEVTFADSFSQELTKRGIQSWIDFRNLIPGHSWQQQLDEAIQNAAAILLVVSRASMASPSVQGELKAAFAMAKRVILITFEPCKLDSELTGLEWVDFTGDFEQAMSQLVGLILQSPQEVNSTPPQRWVHLPNGARKFIPLSILLVFMSMLGGCMTFVTRDDIAETQFQSLVTGLSCLSIVFVWLPGIFIFAFLPMQILRRTHNAQTIRNILMGLLAASLFLWIVQAFITLAGVFSGRELSVLSYVFCSTPSLLTIVVSCIYLNRLLLSKEMYRWSGPTGTLIRIAPPDLTGHTAAVTPMRVAVEFAPQDWRYAQELKASIVKAGHSCTEDLRNADIVLPLLSAYKADSAADPESTRVIPVLIQSCNVDRRLSRIQWVDLRYGKASMDAVAHLLDEPDELLRVLGVLPVRTTIFPNAINWLSIMLSLLLNLWLVQYHVAAWGHLLVPEDVRVHHPIETFLLWLVPILGLYYLRRYIVNRRLRYLPFLSYWWAVGAAVLIAVVSTGYLNWLPFHELFWFIPLFMLHKEIRMWLPSPVARLPALS